MGTQNSKDSPGVGFSSSSSTEPKVAEMPIGEMLCTHLYLLHQPEGVPQVEFVFIHGLQLSDANNAWWTTWARKGARSKCWPKTLLVQCFPKAQVFSLSYDASAIKPATSGKLDSYALGEKLLHNMKIAGIGQRNRPVVFVCHSLGGLVAKQIVVTGYHHFRQDEKVQNLLNNIRGFFFYATPHSGSKLADLCSNLPRMSPLVDHLKLINDGLGRLNSEFEKITKLDEYKDTWKFLAVQETEVTSVGRFSAVVVTETSARFGDHELLSVPEDHFNVCKPESATDTSFVALRNFTSEILQ